jgi:hypothetical protein
MELTIERNYEYVPEWHNNKKDANPVVFEMRMLTTGERDKLMAYNFSSDGQLQIAPERQAMFKTAVLGIRNLKMNGESLLKASDVLGRPGLDGLFTEVVTEIMTQNSREDSKNL